MTKIESDDYKRGWYDGYQAAQNDSTRIYPTQPLGPAKTMDLQWPRDQQAWPVPRTTNPWPLYQACGVCGIGGDINKAMSYVCNNPQCPTRVTCISTTGTTT